MQHLAVFLGLSLGSFLGLLILGGHYFLILMNILIPVTFWIYFIYLIYKKLRLN